MKAIAYEVHGRVQGVSFRAWTVRLAQSLDLAGWVRNRSDGAVEGRVEGPPEQVDVFVGALWKGPPASEVSQVIPREEAPQGLDRFRVAP